MSKKEQSIIHNTAKLFLKNSFFVLGCIIIVGILLRLYYFPYNIPITLDALSYFFYANDVAVLGKIPAGYTFPNNGWPIFISFFFSLVHSSNFLDYMMLQRVITVAISSLTAIPIYLLCNKFVEKKYSLVGASIFVFDPRIIQNSLLGETQPLFILLVATTLFLFLSNNTKKTYASFGVAALLAVVRYEGLLLIIPISAMYLIRFRKEKKAILKIGIGIAIFLTIITPVSYLRVQTTGQNGLTDQVTGGATATGYLIQNEAGGNAIMFIGNGLINQAKFLGWVSIPIFVFFVPIGIVLFVKRDIKTAFVIFVIFVMLIPSLYAYSRDIQDPRYLYVIFPMFCIFSAFTVKKFSDKFARKDIVLLLLILGIIVGSIVFLEYKKVDYKHELEAYQIAKKIDKITNSTNNFYPESKYVRVAELSNITFPTPINGKVFGPTLILTDGYDSLEKYIESNHYLKLQHLVIDDSKDRPNFLRDIYHNEDRYPYLTKVYDSSDDGFEYKVKVFNIDYNRFLDTKR